MHVTRLYIPATLTPGRTLVVDGQPAHHVRHVLRLRTGSNLQVFDGNGKEVAATLVDIGRSEITLELGEPLAALPEPALHITLAQGIARNDRMDLIVQKSVELGVSRIQPLWMQRSQSHLKGERLEKRIAHWRGVITSACEQCGRATLPELQPPRPCADWLAARNEPGLRLLLQPDADRTLKGLDSNAQALTLLIGPEGGMTEEEHGLAAANGFQGIRLGPRILRTETASLAALAGIHALWGDFA